MEGYPIPEFVACSSPMGGCKMHKGKVTSGILIEKCTDEVAKYVWIYMEYEKTLNIQMNILFNSTLK